MKNLSNKPPKGTSDWLPDEFRIRKYIFDTWRKVCNKFGYEEYLTPVIEYADIYRAKSGEDVGGKELMTMLDRAGRELSIRPEMTPSVTRLVTKIYNDTPKPIRFFSIANFLRNENPQRGRNREFWQLNFDIFGSNSILADTEVLKIALEIMLSFNPPKNSFVLYVNNRKLIDDILSNYVKIEPKDRNNIVRILDKWEKLEDFELNSRLSNEGLNEGQIELLFAFMESTNSTQLKSNIKGIENSEGFKEVETILNQLSDYSEWINFNPSIIRGFDYYDGMVFEVFDKHPDNSRAMFGGGRYNGLASIFGSESFPAVGSAPGDETTKLFLEAWNLLPADINSNNIIYIPLLDENLLDNLNDISKSLREKGEKVITGVEKQRLNKALEFANKKIINRVLILGDEEAKSRIYKIKDMNTGEEASFKF